MSNTDVIVGLMRMLGVLKEPSIKRCSRCNAKFNHRGAYCKVCHEKRMVEGKVNVSR